MLNRAITEGSIFEKLQLVEHLHNQSEKKRIRVIFLATGTDEKRHTLKNHFAPTFIVDMTEIFSHSN